MKLYIWDFDSTMYHTPTPSLKEIWENKTGRSWMGKGWWGNPDSLDINIFDIALNQWIYNKYIQAEENSKHYLVTGRLHKMRDIVETIINRDGLCFDDICCNPGNTSTLYFKLKKFNDLVDQTKGVTDVYIYDDRQEHLKEFKKWASDKERELGINIYIIDSVNKVEI